MLELQENILTIFLINKETNILFPFNDIITNTILYMMCFFYYIQHTL